LAALRNADSVVVSTKIFDTNGWMISHGAADINGTTSVFDTFVIFSARGNETASTFQFTRMKVEIIPARWTSESKKNVARKSRRSTLAGR
jgi:hypothetical protein